MVYLFSHSYISKKLFQFLIGVTFLFSFNTSSFSQTTSPDSIIRPSTQVQTAGDTIKVRKEPNHSPKKAAAMSALLPGSGQIYNKKYWKVPVIYAGFAGLTYSFQFNQSRYVKYRDALKYRLDDDSSTTDEYAGVYTDDQLTTLYKYYHRYRDLTVIGAGVLYLLNIVDAAVDAHLFTFDVSDDLTLNLHPALINTARGSGYTTGLGLSIHF
jgi:hypothetical protein